MWIIQLYSLLYGLHEVLNKKKTKYLYVFGVSLYLFMFIIAILQGEKIMLQTYICESEKRLQVNYKMFV